MALDPISGAISGEWFGISRNEYMALLSALPMPATVCSRPTTPLRTRGSWVFRMTTLLTSMLTCKALKMGLKAAPGAAT